jgi:hypothetical protein
MTIAPGDFGNTVGDEKDQTSFAVCHSPLPCLILAKQTTDPKLQADQPS